jgi:hypothetical protein
MAEGQSSRIEQRSAMQSIFVLSIPLCALVLGLGGCAYSSGPVEMITEGDSNFIVTCAPSACAQRATAICQAQGFSRYDIVERRQGDDLGEGGGIVIQCKK